MARLPEILHALAAPSHAGVTQLTHATVASALLLLGRAAQQSPNRLQIAILPDNGDLSPAAQDLAFLAPDLPIHLFPARLGAYQQLPAAPMEKIARLATLTTLLHGSPHGVLLTSFDAFQQWLPPRADFAAWRLTLQPGESWNRDRLLLALVERGYVDMSLVEDRGTFAVRGALIDCWPPHSPLPLRIEFDDQTILEIRTFHPETQRTVQSLAACDITPAEELLFSTATGTALQRTLRQHADGADIPLPQRTRCLNALEQRTYPAWLETLLPFAYPTCDTLFSYLPANARCWWLDSPALTVQHDTSRHALAERWQAAEPMLRLITPDQIYADSAAAKAAQSFAHVIDGPHALPWLDAPAVTHQLETQSERTWATAWRASGNDPVTAALETIRTLTAPGHHVTIVCHTQLAANRAHDLLRWHGMSAAQNAALDIAIGNLSEGFALPDDGLAYLTETALFGKKTRVPKTQAQSAAAAFAGFQDLAPGDCIVHELHGIGKFCGMRHMTVPASPLTPVVLGVMGSGKPTTMQADFVQLEYQGGDKLYLPVYRLHLLQRYIGPTDGTPILDKLGHKRWSQVKQKALATIRTMAHELLKIYAERATRAGIAFSGRDEVLENFESHFPYDETPDQWQAIEDVLRDMQDPKPMDRLICGDVGYGKTEVALRAALRAAADGKQVAILCPTTLLAYQHGQTFAARFAGTGLRVEHISRFRSATEQRALLKELADGRIDIMIGTHRLLSSDVKFPRLGLLIVDEEQRFGVGHKERIRKLRATVDTLTLSATPIPRTLHLALSGLRDVSIIQTAPVDRQAIRTHILPFSERLIREAILRELTRGGEVFFVHNRVRTITGMQERIERLVPEARVVVAHGQMDDATLETAMQQFVDRRANVLLCTSIIEAGLDIPSANTLIVNRADTFGLAQLYQIRGRVGRSNQQAYAYLLTPAVDDVAADADIVRITPHAQRRLATLARYTELGSGFSIAMQDLEIRGAGNLLGAQQSGQLEEIGYDLFQRLLERTIRGLKGEREIEEIDPEITLPVPALLPAEYIPDDNMRLIWYKRLSSCSSAGMLEGAESELADRFGPLPDEAQSLLAVIDLRIRALQLRMTMLQYQAGIWRLQLHRDTPIDPKQVLTLVNRHPKRYQLKPDGVIIVRQVCETPSSLFSTARHILQELLPE